MDSSSEMTEKAYQQLQEGYFEDAIEAFSNCLLLDSAHARSYFGRGMAYCGLKKWQPAFLDFQRAQEIDPEDPQNRVACAMSLAMDNKIYEAIELFEQLLAQNPRYIPAHVQLAKLYYGLGVIGKGHQQLDLALGSRPSLSERRMIEELKKEQLTLDKRRYYRPDFEMLRRQNPFFSIGFFKRVKNFFGIS